MKITVELKEEYPISPQVLIQCNENNQEVQEIVHLLESKDRKLIGSLDHEEHVLDPKDVLYAESVDGVTYLYTSENVYRTAYSLSELEQMCSSRGYFRCSKSSVLNIHAIKSLKSEVGNRIDACLRNEEHIVISRRYAKHLRAILKGGDAE